MNSETDLEPTPVVHVLQMSYRHTTIRSLLLAVAATGYWATLLEILVLLR